MDNDSFWIGAISGILFGVIFAIIMLSFVQTSANIDYERGYQTINAVKITKYSDGMQIIETTAYMELLGMRLSENYTYTDQKNLISELGMHKIKTTDDGIIRNIGSVIYVEEVIS